MSKTIPSLYDFKGHSIRVVTIDDTPWFVAADNCKALGILHTPTATRNVVSSRINRVAVAGQPGRPMLVVSEAGLYELVLQSRKPEAQAFREWVTGTVLPAIRKDGGYIRGEEKAATGDMSEDELVLMAMDVMRRKIDRSISGGLPPSSHRAEDHDEKDEAANACPGLIVEIVHAISPHFCPHLTAFGSACLYLLPSCSVV